MSLWTETPAERQQGITDEVQGKKRRVTDAPVEDDDAQEVIRKRRQKSVDDHTRMKRGAALIEQHVEAISKYYTTPVHVDNLRHFDLSRY